MPRDHVDDDLDDLDDEDLDDSEEVRRPAKKRRPTADERQMAMFCHLGGVIGGFLVPLIIWNIKKDDSRFIDDHGKEALNFGLTMMIGHLVGGLLFCFTLGLLNVALMVMTVVFVISASTAANRGERYEYPWSIRFIK